LSSSSNFLPDGPPQSPFVGVCSAAVASLRRVPLSRRVAPSTRHCHGCTHPCSPHLLFLLEASLHQRVSNTAPPLSLASRAWWLVD
jgi:hypothetical protein